MGDARKVAVIDYTNHRGERTVRSIYPKAIVFENSEWHPETQWLLEATDLEKHEPRTFAMSKIHSFQPSGRQASIDMSIARQLQRSMERNARMVTRLQDLAARVAKTDPANVTPFDLLMRLATELPAAVAAILKDEDPTWTD